MLVLLDYDSFIAAVSGDTTKQPEGIRIMAKKPAASAAATTAAASTTATVTPAAVDPQHLSAVRELQAGTDSGVGYQFVTKAVGDFLASKGHAELGEADASGNVAARITPAGRAFINENTPVQTGTPFGGSPALAGANTGTLPTDGSTAGPDQSELSAAAAAGGKFKIVTGLNIPKAQRLVTNTLYPFADLPVGGGFFVPETADSPKSMASTCATASLRYATETGATRNTRKGNQVPVLKYERYFEARRLADGKDFGPEFAGVKGFGVYRTDNPRNAD